MIIAAFDDGLTRAYPAAHGLDAGRIDAFLDEAARLGVELHSFMMWKGGDVIAEGWWSPYRADRRHMMHSATKSFLSAGIGLAIDEGRFALEDKVISFFPDHLPDDIGANLAAMTVEDLLTQTSGHSHGVSGSIWRSIPTSWIAEFFKIPVVHPPGAKFVYSSATSFMLSAILTKVTGGTAHQYLKPRLLEPLGITDLAWDVGPEDINPGGNGISARSSDLLKLAILHQRGGVWNGRQILPAEWARAATTDQRGHGHGYHWWVGPGRNYYAYGVFGQFAFVFPDQDAVLAVTAAAPKGEVALRDVVWDHAPRLFDTTNGARPSDSPAELRARCEALRLLGAPPVDKIINTLGSGERQYAVEPNAEGILQIGFSFSAGTCVFKILDARGSHIVKVGLGSWLESETTVSGASLHHGYEPEHFRVVAAGAWTAENVFEMTWQFVETAFRDSIRLQIDAENLLWERSVNVNSGALRSSPIRGRRI